MKTRTLLLFFTVFLLYNNAFSQTCPPNLDLEEGSFANWECSIGRTNAVAGKNNIILTPSAPIAGRHEIISGPSSAKDMYGNFPQLCPYGGKYSVKLGNNSTGGEAEGMSYTFTVPSGIDTFSFTYFYAVVFQDPQHSTFEQPRFFVTAYDVETGDLINCASYNYVSSGGLPGFKVSKVSPDVLYKEWSPVSIQFAGLADRKVRLEFKTADCTLGGHFGYAYLDVGSGCSNILATAPYCVETNSIILNAPYGFKTYTWYNQDYSAVVGNQQSLTLSPPPATSGTFHVDIVPYPNYGCRDTADALVTPLPVPDTPVAPNEIHYCQYDFPIAITATPSPGCDLLWYANATGGTGGSTPFIPATATSGIQYYYVSQKILFGCESFRKKIAVIVHPTPDPLFNINNNKQCLVGNQFEFTSLSTNLENTTYFWDFGDGQKIDSTDSIAKHSFSNYGNFNVKLKVLNKPNCFKEKTLQVTVIPSPLAKFSSPPLICQDETTVVLKDNSSIPAGLDQINKWWWSINDKVITTQNPVPFLAATPGKMTVKLVATSVQGCYSDTSMAIFDVRFRPAAAFKYSKPLCDNETIQFTNLSSLPQSAVGESIDKWYWQFDATSKSLAKDPSWNFTPGPYGVKLIVETNYGCKSTIADSALEINSKPKIDLTINDSCVMRAIRYNGIDVSNSVNKWLWDFGKGFNEGSSLIIKSYATEGYRPLTLIGLTVHGCKDTLIRPFTIYDNKAFAGRDTITANDEPVQLNAHGGADLTYVWSPNIGLNDATIENPVAIWDKDQLYQLDALTKEGCDSHSKILIKRYKGPDLYIPTGFTPNHDGTNDVIKVFPVGIKQFHFFSIYNRWGELIYKTTDQKFGWDGKYKGADMASGTFVAVAQAIDYKGNLMRRKVLITLIR